MAQSSGANFAPVDLLLLLVALNGLVYLSPSEKNIGVVSLSVSIFKGKDDLGIMETLPILASLIVSLPT